MEKDTNYRHNCEGGGAVVSAIQTTKDLQPNIKKAPKN